MTHFNCGGKFRSPFGIMENIEDSDRSTKIQRLRHKEMNVVGLHVMIQYGATGVAVKHKQTPWTNEHLSKFVCLCFLKVFSL